MHDRRVSAVGVIDQSVWLDEGKRGGGREGEGKMNMYSDTKVNVDPSDPSVVEPVFSRLKLLSSRRRSSSLLAVTQQPRS